MSATDALKAAWAAGVDLHVDGDDLVLDAPAPPPARVLDLLSRHKPAILAILRRDAVAPAGRPRQALQGEAAAASGRVAAQLHGCVPAGRIAPSWPASDQSGTAGSGHLRSGAAAGGSGQTVAAWDAETKKLIAWFRRSAPPSRPFQLSPGVTVLNPSLWWASIAADIEAGPLGPRARYGALQADLRRLYAIMVDGDTIERL